MKITGIKAAALTAALSSTLFPLSARAQDAGLAAIVEPKFNNVYLYAQTRNGLEMRPLSRQLHIWWPWQTMQNTTGVPQTQWDKNMVGIAWLNPFDPNSFFRMFAFFAFEDPNQNAAIRVQHHITSGVSSVDPNTGYIFGGVSLRSANFAPMFPKTGYALGNTFRLWGTDVASSTRYVPSDLPTLQPSRVRMRSFDSFTGVHINQDFGPVPGFQPELLMGPEGSVNWDLPGISDDVQLVAVAQSDIGSKVFSIQCLLQEGSAAARWLSLRWPGNPNIKSGRARAPLAVGYQRFGEARIRVFVVAMDDIVTNGEKRWKLYSIERTQGGQWLNDRGEAGRWNDHGFCPDTPLQQGNEEPTPRDANGVPIGFSLNSRIVWKDNAGNQRVNLFGATDNGRFLVEFFFNGATWQWGLQPHVVPPGKTIKATANGVGTRDGQEFRLSTFARMTDDSIWEHFYDTLQGGQWKWLQLR